MKSWQGRRQCLSWQGTGWERGRLSGREWLTCRRCCVCLCVYRSFRSVRNSTSSGPTQASRAQDCSHRMQSFLGLVPLIAQQVEAGQRDVEHGQVLGHRPPEQGGWRVPATSRRFPICPWYKKKHNVCSGWGFMWETQIAKCYANSRVSTIYAGTNEIMKELIARNITRAW